MTIAERRSRKETGGRRGVKPNLDNCKVVEEPSQHENHDGGGATVGCFWDLHNIFQVLAKRPPLRSPGDLLRVAFSGLCVVLYANWIKNVTHFPKLPYLSSCVKQISKHLIGMKIIRGEKKPFCSIINWEMLLMSNNFHCAFPDSIVAAGSRQERGVGCGVSLSSD